MTVVAIVSALFILFIVLGSVLSDRCNSQDTFAVLLCTSLALVFLVVSIHIRTIDLVRDTGCEAACGRDNSHLISREGNYCTCSNRSVYVWKGLNRAYE